MFLESRELIVGASAANVITRPGGPEAGPCTPRRAAAAAAAAAGGREGRAGQGGAPVMEVLA